MHHVYQAADANNMQFPGKHIAKYPTPTKEYDVAYMKVTGRNPEGSAFALEEECSFVCYVTKGSGIFIFEDSQEEVSEGSVIFVEKNTKFAVDGEFEYVTFVSPAWYPEQYKEV